MHNYKIEIFNYTPEGAIGEKFKTMYADNVEGAELICDEYSNQYQSVEVDGEMVKSGNKKYKVVLSTLAYKVIADRDSFFANFKA